MTNVTIGPCRIADDQGTHEPGTTVEDASDALIALAEALTADPETGLPYASLAGETEPAGTQPETVPEPEPEPAAEPDPTPEPAEEAAQ